MSKKSCEATGSIEDALLRMARVNCNLPERGGRFHACMKICLQEGTKGAPFYEQKELQSSGKHRRCAFANGASEL